MENMIIQQSNYFQFVLICLKFIIQTSITMIQQFLSILVILLVYIFYNCWLKPRRIMKKYVKDLRQLGYKVLEAPYNPFTHNMVQTYRKGIEQGDAMKIYKQLRFNYDVLVTNAFSNPRIQIYHPDFHKQLFGVDKHYQYPKVQKVVQSFSRINGKGLIFSQGKEWYRKRKILNKVFNFDFLRSQTVKIANICQKSFETIENRAPKSLNNNQVQYNIFGLTVQIFSSVMLEIFLGGSNKQIIKGMPAGQFTTKIMSDINNQIFKPINVFLGPKFTRMNLTKSQRQISTNINLFREWGIGFVRKRIIQIKQNMKEKNIKKEVPSDIIESLFMAKNDENSEQIMSSQSQIFEQFVTFFIAGTDTTSSFTEMMIYLIALHPEVERKVRQQIQTYMNTEDYSFGNLKSLVYIDSVQKEVTRFYGPAVNMFSRVAQKDNYLNGLLIKKDTHIGLFFICNHYNEKYFKNPKEFRPERWQHQCKDLPNFVFQGFGGGARTCIGKHLALLQNKIAIIKFMKRYKSIILPKKQIKMVFKFLYGPQQFLTKLVKTDKQV